MNILNKFKRIFAVVATFTLLAGNASVAIAQTFNDVPTNHWAFDYIEKLVDQGVFDVSDTFRPNDALNRAELAKIVITAVDGLAGYQAPATATFDDVATDAWYYDYVEAAVQLGIVAGYTDAAGNLTGKFGPLDMVNRAQATKVLVNAFNVPTTLTPAGTFADVSSSAWFYNYVTTAYNQSILSGYANGMFGPADPVTRAQVAKLVVNSQSPVVRAGDDTTTPAPVDDDTTTPAPVLAAGALEVSLNDHTARSSTIPLSATNVELASFDLTAADSDVTISNLSFTRGGVGTSSDFQELFLYNGLKRLTTSRTVNNDTNVVTFPVSIKVDAGTTTTLRLVGRLGTTGTNNQHYFYLASASDVTSTAQSVAGDFPVAGNTITIGSVSVNTLTLTTGTAISQPLIGAADAEVSTFRAQAGATNDIALHNMTITQNGTLSSSRMNNCKLLRGNDVVASTAAFDDRERISFVLDTPFLIPKGQIKNFYVHCNIDGGKASDTIELYLDETSDIVAIDQQYGAGAGITNTSYTTAGVTATSLKGGKVTVTDNGPAAHQVAQNVTNIELLNYSITTDRDLTVKDATVTISLTDGTNTPDIAGTLVTAGAYTSAAASGVNYDITTDNDVAGTVDSMVAGDMIILNDGTTNYYARVVSNDGDASNAGFIVASTSNLVGLSAATTIAEVNPYAYLKNLRVIDKDTGGTVQGPLTLVSGGTSSAVADTVYRKQFTEDYELMAGKTRHLAIVLDTDQYAVAGYQATATISYSTTDATGAAATAVAATGGFIKDFAANENVANGDIVGNPLTGKPMTIAANSFTVGLAATPNPTNTSFIKGQTGVQATGFTLTAGDAGDITLKKLTLRAIADDDGDFSGVVSLLGDTEAKNVITSIALYDGNTLVGEGKAPVAVSTWSSGAVATGYDQVQFQDLQFVIPAGTTKTLTAVINLQSSLTGTNYVGVYMVPSADVTTEDKDANSITASPTTAVNAQAGATLRPARVVQVDQNGTLSISQNSSPQANLMVAGTTRQLVAQYRFSASREAWNVQRLTILNDTTGAFDTAADTSAVTKVTIDYPDVNGVTQSIGQSLASGSASFANLTPALYVPKDGVAILKVYADVNTTEYGQTLSGQSFRMGLRGDDLATANSDAEGGTFKAVGAASGSSEYNPTITGGSTNVYEHIVRFSIPVITKDGGDEALSNGAKNLYAAKVTADAAGPRGIAIKRIVFRLSVVFTFGTDDLSSFRIREGFSGTDLTNTEANIVGKTTAGASATYLDTSDTTLTWIDVAGASTTAARDGFVVVDFTSERSITAGSSKTFVLRAEVAGASVSGEQVSTYIPDDSVSAASGGAGTVAKFPGCYTMIDAAAGAGVSTAVTGAGDAGVGDATVLLDSDCDGTADTGEFSLDVVGVGNGTTGITAEASAFATQTGLTSAAAGNVRGQLAVMDPDTAADDDHYFWFDADADGALDTTEIVVARHGTIGDVTALNASAAVGFQASPGSGTTFRYAYVELASTLLIYDADAGAGRAMAVFEIDAGNQAYTAGEIGMDLVGETADTAAVDLVFVGTGTQVNFIWSDNSSSSPAHSDNSTDWTSGYLVDTLSSPAKTMSY